MPSSEISRAKTIFVLAIVVGCFAVLWPKVFYPMFQGGVAPEVQHKDEPICCGVVFEMDTYLQLVCTHVLHKDLRFARGSVARQALQECRENLMENCQIDIRAPDYRPSQNLTMCLRDAYGVDDKKLHHRPNGSVHIPRHMKPERPAHLHPEVMHPGLREKGRTIPSQHDIRNGRPPIGVRPPMGAGAHGSNTQKGVGVGGGGAMSILMPLYTIGIVVFFVYTVMKVLFKKQPESDEPKIKDFGMDPEHRKFLYEAKIDEPEISSRTMADMQRATRSADASPIPDPDAISVDLAVAPEPEIPIKSTEESIKKDIESAVTEVTEELKVTEEKVENKEKAVVNEVVEKEQTEIVSAQLPPTDNQRVAAELKVVDQPTESQTAEELKALEEPFLTETASKTPEILAAEDVKQGDVISEAVTDSTPVLEESAALEALSVATDALTGQISEVQAAENIPAAEEVTKVETADAVAPVEAEAAHAEPEPALEAVNAGLAGEETEKVTSVRDAEESLTETPISKAETLEGSEPAESVEQLPTTEQIAEETAVNQPEDLEYTPKDEATENAEILTSEQPADTEKPEGAEEGVLASIVQDFKEIFTEISVVAAEALGLPEADTTPELAIKSELTDIQPPAESEQPETQDAPEEIAETQPEEVEVAEEVQKAQELPEQLTAVPELPEVKSADLPTDAELNDSGLIERGQPTPSIDVGASSVTETVSEVDKVADILVTEQVPVVDFSVSQICEINASEEILTSETNNEKHAELTQNEQEKTTREAEAAVGEEQKTDEKSGLEDSLISSTETAEVSPEVPETPATTEEEQKDNQETTLEVGETPKVSPEIQATTEEEQKDNQETTQEVSETPEVSEAPEVQATTEEEQKDNQETTPEVSETPEISPEALEVQATTEEEQKDNQETTLEVSPEAPEVQATTEEEPKDNQETAPEVGETTEISSETPEIQATTEEEQKTDNKESEQPTESIAQTPDVSETPEVTPEAPEIQATAEEQTTEEKSDVQDNQETGQPSESIAQTPEVSPDAPEITTAEEQQKTEEKPDAQDKQESEQSSESTAQFTETKEVAPEEPAADDVKPSAAETTDENAAVITTPSTVTDPTEKEPENEANNKDTEEQTTNTDVDSNLPGSELPKEQDEKSCEEVVEPEGPGEASEVDPPQPPSKMISIEEDRLLEIEGMIETDLSYFLDSSIPITEAIVTPSSTAGVEAKRETSGTPEEVEEVIEKVDVKSYVRDEDLEPGESVEDLLRQAISDEISSKVEIGSECDTASHEPCKVATIEEPLQQRASEDEKQTDEAPEICQAIPSQSEGREVPECEKVDIEEPVATEVLSTVTEAKPGDADKESLSEDLQLVKEDIEARTEAVSTASTQEEAVCETVDAKKDSAVSGSVPLTDSISSEVFPTEYEFVENVVDTKAEVTNTSEVEASCVEDNQSTSVGEVSHTLGQTAEEAEEETPDKTAEVTSKFGECCAGTCVQELIPPEVTSYRSLHVDSDIQERLEDLRKKKELEMDLLRKRLEETEAAMERIVAQMGTASEKLLTREQYDKDLSSTKKRLKEAEEHLERLKAAKTPEDISEFMSAVSDSVLDVTILPEVEDKVEEKVQSLPFGADAIATSETKISVIGMEITAQSEDGGKLPRPQTPTKQAVKPSEGEVTSVLLEALVPTDSQLLVSEAECRAEAVPLEQLDLDESEYEAAPVVLSGKMTLSVMGMELLADPEPEVEHDVTEADETMPSEAAEEKEGSVEPGVLEEHITAEDHHFEARTPKVRFSDTPPQEMIIEAYDDYENEAEQAAEETVNGDEEDDCNSRFKSAVIDTAFEGEHAEAKKDEHPSDEELKQALSDVKKELAAKRGNSTRADSVDEIMKAVDEARRHSSKPILSESVSADEPLQTFSTGDCTSETKIPTVDPSVYSTTDQLCTLGQEVVSKEEIAYVETAPEAVEAFPEAVEANPEAVEATPEPVKAAPEAVEQKQEAVEAIPETVEAAPETVEAAPAAVETASEAVEAAPEAVEQKQEEVVDQKASVLASAQGSTKEDVPVATLIVEMTEIEPKKTEAPSSSHQDEEIHTLEESIHKTAESAVEQKPPSTLEAKAQDPVPEFVVTPTDETKSFENPEDIPDEEDGEQKVSVSTKFLTNLRQDSLRDSAGKLKDTPLGRSMEITELVIKGPNIEEETEVQVEEEEVESNEFQQSTRVSSQDMKPETKQVVVKARSNEEPELQAEIENAMKEESLPASKGSSPDVEDFEVIRTEVLTSRLQPVTPDESNTLVAEKPAEEGIRSSSTESSSYEMVGNNDQGNNHSPSPLESTDSTFVPVSEEKKE